MADTEKKTAKYRFLVDTIKEKIKNGEYEPGERMESENTLSEQFAPVIELMDFVASNGAQVMVAGELVDLEVFSHAAVKRLARVVDMFDTMHLALFDETRSYLLDDEARFEREVDKNLPNPVRVFDVPSPQTSILKASVYCDDAVMDMAYILTRELDDDFVFAPSGRKWIESCSAA